MKIRPLRSTLAVLLVAVLGVGCVALDYDLSTVPVPISAKPAVPADGAVEPFTLEASNVLWFYGLFGHDQPDVSAMIAERAEGSGGIAGFRIRQKGSMLSWFAAHLSLTLVRMRTVVIEGELLPAGG